MKTKILYFGVAVLILLIVSVYVYGRGQEAEAPVTQSNSTTTGRQDEVPQSSQSAPEDQAATQQPVPQPAPEQANGHFAGEDEIGAPDIVVHEVAYNGSAFSPSSLTVKVGDIVIFRNGSSTGFRPASDPHPSHTTYPEFDAKAAIVSGDTFDFKFTKVGSWGYHDHFNSGSKGTIIVKQ